MSTAVRKLAVAGNEPIRLDAHRRPRRQIARRGTLKIAAVFAVCFLGLIGSFADSAVARTGLLLIGASDDPSSNLDGVGAILLWATVANLAACAGIVMIIYWLVSLPSAEIVELRPRRYKR
jgi:hypothetical protein